MRRRTWLAAGVAATAAAVGAGLAWWQRRPSTASATGESTFWQQRFETPEGGLIAMADLRGRPLLINFWATWCPPCVEEMPEIERFYQSHREAGWEVLGLAADRAEAVRGFLQRTSVSFPVALAGLAGTQWSRAFGNTSGALPFTVLLDRQGEVRQRKLGQTSLKELQGWAREMR